MYLDFTVGSKSKGQRESKCSAKNVYSRVIPKKPVELTEFSSMILKAILSKHIELDRNQKEEIFKNVEQLDFRQGNYFGGVDILDENSCVSLLDHDNTTIMASSVFGEGKTIVFNHESIFKEFLGLNKDWIIFMRNIIRWLTKNKENSPENRIKILMNSASPNTKIISALERASLYIQIDYQCVLLQANLSDYDCIFLCEVSTKTSVEDDCNNIIQFVKNGGGLLVAFRGWTFANYGEGKYMKDWANECFNGKILAPMGLRLNLSCSQLDQIKLSPEEIIELDQEKQQRQYTQQENPQYVQNYEENNSSLKQDREFLLEGVEECILGQGMAVSSFAYSPKLFTPIFREQQKDFCVAGRFGSGKVFAYGHPNIYSKQFPSNQQAKRFLQNILRWMCGQKQDLVVGLLHEQGQWNKEEISLRDLNRNVQVKFINHQDDLNDVDIVCGTYYHHFPNTMNPDFNSRVKQFVENGGNLFFASHGWVWQNYGEYTQNNSLTFQQNFGSYLLLKQLGLHLKKDCFGVPNPFQPQIHLSMTKDPIIHQFLQQDFLQVLRNNEATNFQASDEEVDKHLSKINSVEPSLFQLICSIQLYHQLVEAFVESRFNVERNYDKLSFHDPFICRVFNLMNALSYACPPFICRALPPSLNVYPGYASNRLAERTVEVFKNRNKIVLTGLYINPGQVVKVTHNNDLNDTADLELKVNFNLDLTNWDNGNLKRFTHISKSFKIKENEFYFASPHGGIIYFQVSTRSENDQPLLFTFHGAYEAPYWNENIHSYEQFETLKKIDAPFFAIETKRVILIGRTQKIFGYLKIKIEKLCNFWNTVIGHIKDYRGIEEFPFEKQAYFNDANIMLGYMHSGTPVMTHEDLTFQMLGVGGKLFRDATWGFYHELGHNHQDYKWTINQMIEVTCNIYSLYLTHKMHGFTIQKEFWIDSKTQENVNKYFSKPSRTLQDYGQDAFVGLGLFAIIMEQFGYEVFSTVHKRYQNINLPEESPEAKVDMLVEQVSEVIGYNLWYYFKNWGLPVTKKSLKKIENLKKYKCKRFPVITQN